MGPKNGVFADMAKMARAVGVSELVVERLAREKQALHEAYEKWEEDAARLQMLLAAVVWDAKKNGGEVFVTAEQIRALPARYQVRSIPDKDGSTIMLRVEPLAESEEEAKP